MSWLLESLKSDELKLMGTISYPLSEEQFQSVVDFAYRCDGLYHCVPSHEKRELRDIIRHWGNLLRMTKGEIAYFPNLHSTKPV